MVPVVAFGAQSVTELRYQYQLYSGKYVVLSIHKYNRLPLSNMLDQQSRDAELQCTGSARYGYLIRRSVQGGRRSSTREMSLM